MTQILIYLIIVSFGVFLTKKNILPNFIKSKLGYLQNIALFILIATIGYKIGIDDSLLSNIKNIGVDALILAIFTGGGSIIVTYVSFKIINVFINKNRREGK